MAEKKQDGFDKLIIALRVLSLAIFPSFMIMNTNSSLSKCKEITGDSWFTRQRLKNSLISLILFCISIFVLNLGYNEIKSNKIFEKQYSSFVNEIKNLRPKKAISSAVVLFKDKSAKETLIKVSIPLSGLMFLSLFIFTAHPIIYRNRKLKKVLKKNGVLNDKDEPIPAFYTPKGILLYLSGQDPKEITTHKRIWSSINTKVDEKEWLEDKYNRSIVFVPSCFELNHEYIYKDV